MSAKPPATRQLTRLDDADIEALSDVLIDCVEGGASISFMAPMHRDAARTFWRGIGSDLAAGRRALLIVEDAAGIVGTVHLVLAQPENQPHRADLVKLMVHRRARCLGVGEALMRDIEVLARSCGKSLLVLDTASDAAERLYQRLGWMRCGTIPNYALLPEGGLCPATFFYRELEGCRPA